MKIDDLKTLFELKGNEYQLGSLNGDEFNLIANLAQRDYFNFLLGHIEQYQYGRPVPRVGMGMGVNVMDKLSPFRKNITLSPAIGGQITKPVGVAKLQRMGRDSEVEIHYCDPGCQSSRIGSTIVPIADNPIYVDEGGYWQIYPSDYTGQVVLEYIEEPTDMKWNYTYRNGREVYLESGSVHPQWKDNDMNHILSRMLRHKGVPFKDGELISMATQEIDKGE